MKETNLRQRLRSDLWHALGSNGLVYHVPDAPSVSARLADLLVIFNGHVLAIEVKVRESIRPKEHVQRLVARPLQVYYNWVFQKAGCLFVYAIAAQGKTFVLFYPAHTDKPFEADREGTVLPSVVMPWGEFLELVKEMNKQFRNANSLMTFLQLSRSDDSERHAS